MTADPSIRFFTEPEILTHHPIDNSLSKELYLMGSTIGHSCREALGMRHASKRLGSLHCTFLG